MTIAIIISLGILPCKYFTNYFNLSLSFFLQLSLKLNVLKIKVIHICDNWNCRPFRFTCIPTIHL